MLSTTEQQDVCRAVRYRDETTCVAALSGSREMPDSWVTKNPMELFRLDGKVAIVTGSASGSGRASATMFARAGRGGGI